MDKFKEIIIKISIAMFLSVILYVSGVASIYVCYGAVIGILGYEIIKFGIKSIRKN